MSTIPLSSVDPIDESEKIANFQAEPSPKAEANDRLDKFVSGVVDRLHPDEEPAPKSRKSLDENLSENLDRHYAAQADQESFTASREAREELQTRYKDHGDLGQTLDAYIGWAKRFRDDPREAGLAFAESYALASPYGLKEHKPKAKVETYVDPGGKRYSGAKLSSIIEDAMENATSEKKAFTATAKQREALKQIFPNKSFDEAIATIVKIDADAYRDPAGTAAQIAAGFGMDWTPRQQQARQQYDTDYQAANVAIQQARQMVPDFDQHRVAMAHIIQSGQANNLQDAYVMAVQQYQQHDQVRQALNALGQTDPGYAKATADAMLGKDQGFNAHAKQIGVAHDPVAKLRAALSWTEAKMHSAAVSKAKRATPVKSSSGAFAPSGAGRGDAMDRAISSAMAGKY